MKKMNDHERHPETRETIGEAIDRATIGRWNNLTQGGCLTRILTFVMIVGLMVSFAYCRG